MNHFAAACKSKVNMASLDIDTEPADIKILFVGTVVGIQTNLIQAGTHICPEEAL